MNNLKEKLDVQVETNKKLQNSQQEINKNIKELNLWLKSSQEDVNQPAGAQASDTALQKHEVMFACYRNYIVYDLLCGIFLCEISKPIYQVHILVIDEIREQNSKESLDFVFSFHGITDNSKVKKTISRSFR